MCLLESQSTAVSYVPKGAGAILLCAVEQINEMMVLAVWHSVTSAVVGAGKEKVARTCDPCSEILTT